MTQEQFNEIKEWLAKLQDMKDVTNSMKTLKNSLCKIL